MKYDNYSVVYHLTNHVILWYVKIVRSTTIEEKIVAISDLRRRFGRIERALPFVDRFILTKKGRPFAVLSATLSVKRNLMEKTAGALKGTKWDSDNFWKSVLKRKSRKEDIIL